jgi:predicted  nucleic acid-binding Zn-ribbon protein
MDQPSYEHWWALHARVAKGESLTPAERTLYESGLRQLQEEESHPESLQELRQARATVRARQAELAQLAARREHLEAEIESLEEALTRQTRQLLDVED